jgi:hypothetical protein
MSRFIMQGTGAGAGAGKALRPLTLSRPLVPVIRHQIHNIAKCLTLSPSSSPKVFLFKQKHAHQVQQSLYLSLSSNSNVNSPTHNPWIRLKPMLIHLQTDLCLQPLPAKTQNCSPPALPCSTLTMTMTCRLPTRELPLSHSRMRR